MLGRVGSCACLSVKGLQVSWVAGGHVSSIHHSGLPVHEVVLK